MYNIDDLLVINENKHICLICLCDIETCISDGALFTRCGHFFHRECFIESQKYSACLNTCPYCRQNIFKKSNLCHIAQKDDYDFKVGDRVYVISKKIPGKAANVVRQSKKCVWVQPIEESWEGRITRVKKSSVLFI